MSEGYQISEIFPGPGADGGASANCVTSFNGRNGQVVLNSQDVVDALGYVPGAGGSGTGDMTKAVYDPDDNGIVDHAALADSAPWAGITGKPTTFPPSAHTHVIADVTALQAALDGKQPLDADLTALAALTTAGFAIRTAVDTWQARALLAADIPDLDAAKIASGTIALARIGGLTSSQLSPTAGITPAQLSASAVTITPSTGLSGGGTVTLGGAVSISVVPDSTVQRIRVSKNGSLFGTRQELNFIQGSNITLGINDDSVNNKVDVTIASASPNTLAGLSDVNLNAPANGQTLTYDSASGKWINATVSGSVTTSGSPAAGQLAYFSSASAITGSANGTFSSNASDTTLTLVSSSSATANRGHFRVLAYGANANAATPEISLESGRGTPLSPTTTQNNDRLGRLWFYGRGGSAQYDGALIQGTARETWGASSAASAVEFLITRSGQNATALRASFEPDASDNSCLYLYGAPSTAKGGFRYDNGTAKVQFSHDGTTWVDLGSSSSGLADPAANGIVVRTGLNTTRPTQLLAGSSKISITNPTAVLADPILDIVEANIALNNLAGTLGVAKGGTGLASLGSANYLLGVNAAGNANEYKQLIAGANISITHGAGTTTIAATGGGTPGGSDKQLQFNNAGALGGMAGSSWDNASRSLSFNQALNGYTNFDWQNSSTGASAGTSFNFGQDLAGTQFVRVGYYNSGNTFGGYYAPNGGILEAAGAGGLTVSSVNAPLYLATGGTDTANRRITIAPTGGVTINAPVSFQKATASQVVTLTDAANISTDAALGNRFRVTLAGNRTLAPPTNPTADQQCVWEFVQDGTGSRTITLDTGTGGFAFGTDITAITLTTAANKRDFMTATYNATLNKWLVIGFIRGY